VHYNEIPISTEGAVHFRDYRPVDAIHLTHKIKMERIKTMSKTASHLPRLAALICAATLLLFTIAGQAQQPLQVLHNHVRPAVAGGRAAPVGLLPPAQRLNLAIMLPLRNQSDLNRLLDRLYDPTSPDYHQFLSVAQFTEQFGPTQQDYQAVVAFAKANGLTVTDTPSNRLLVDVNGSVAQIEKAFHVQMKLYLHPTENRTFYSPDREPSLDLSVPVSHIAGLNSFSIPRPMLKKGTAAQQMVTSNAGSGPGGAYLGSDMRAAYYGGTALTGTGQAVAMVEFDGYNMSDVTGTFDGHSYTVPINNVLIDGASGGSDGDDGEQVLDIVQAIAMAPGLSQLRVYIAPISTSIGVGDVDMFNKIATENIAKSISCSWGWNPADTAANDPIFQEYAAQGQNLFVASGDSGAYTGSNATDSSFPAEDVYVVAVGGTDLTTNGAGGPWQSETAWPDSGGGPADNGFAIPSWQVGVADSGNAASTTIRNVPDVAAEGNFDNYLCDNGSCQGGWGGTSFAAPRWAGFLALINQQAVANTGLPLGFINPAIYAIGKGTSYNSDFHDITSGNNNNGKGKSYNAVVGYDLVTGWGSPNGQSLINALAGSAAPNFTLSDSPSSLTITQGGAGGTSTITVTDLNGFNGSVSLAASGLPSGVTAVFNPTSTTSTSTLTLTASGTATLGTVTVTITGTSGSLVATTTLTLTVQAQATPNFTISASPASLTVKTGGTGTSTITITSQNSFSSATTLTATGLPSGVTAAFAPNPVTPPANGTVTSVLTFTASSTATVGTSTVTVTGTSGSLVHTTTIALTVSSATAQTAVYNSTLKAPGCATVGTSCDSGASLLLGRDTLSGGAEPHQPNTINNSCADGTSGTFHSDESNDRIVVASTSGALTHGATATVTATVWAWSGYTSDSLDLYYAANANSPTWVLIKTIKPTKAGAQSLSATFTLPTGALQAVRAQFRYQGSASACTVGAYNDHDDLIFAVQ
jgi:subtilase family serine protease